MNAKYVTLLIIVAFSFTQCKKDKTTEDPNAIIYLRDKTPSEVKAAIIGNWKIHYIFGYGITGQPTKTETPNSFFRVQSNDSVYLTFNGTLETAAIATYKRINTAFGYDATTINFPRSGGAPDAVWVYDFKVRDSLWLQGNCVSCGGYMLTRNP